jgi:flagellar biosynthesis/type III secretory pathway chaperone
MTNDMAQTPVIALSELLDVERAALLKGDLDQVTKLLESKEALFGQIGAETRHEEEVLRALDEKMKRNQLLLGGALEGIKVVTERMVALRRVQTSLETYGADGRKNQIKLKPPSSVERRA